MTETLFQRIQNEAESGTKLSDLKKKSEELRKSNTEYLETYKAESQKVLEGKERDAQQKSQLEKAADQSYEFISYVANTVDGLTGEFSNMQEYLGKVTQYEISEKVVGLLFKRKAENMRTERILKTGLDKNIQKILDYYQSMRDVLYTSAVDTQKCSTEIKNIRDKTLAKLDDNEPLYMKAQAKCKELNAKLKAIDTELTTLTGKERTKKEIEKKDISDALKDSKDTEEYHFAFVDNAQKDLKYQEGELSKYDAVARALVISITSMEQKLENRTPLMKSIEYLIKTTHRVRSASLADKAFSKTMAEVVKTSTIQEEAILGELGQRQKARPMAPEEFDSWLKRSEQSRAKFYNDLDEAKVAYAAPGL